MNLAELYTKNKEIMVRKLTAYSHDVFAAEDAVQFAYLKALKENSLSETNEEAARSWLYVTARNALTDEKRKISRLAALTFDVEIPLDEPDQDDMILLNDLLKFLTPEQKEIVTLRYLTGLDSTAIGQMLGIPAATIRTRLRAAIKELRNRLDLPTN